MAVLALASLYLLQDTPRSFTAGVVWFDQCDICNLFAISMTGENDWGLKIDKGHKALCPLSVSCARSSRRSPFVPFWCCPPGTGICSAWSMVPSRNLDHHHHPCINMQPRVMGQ